MSELERWVPIKGYDGKYAVSNNERIRRLAREIFDRDRGCFRVVDSKIMKQQKHSKGYMTVRLCNDYESKTEYVHRLVASSFLMNPLDLPQVNHIDGNKENNSVENLEWCTNVENSNHATKIGLWGPSKPVVCVNEKKVFRSAVDAGKHYGIPSSGISACCSGERKTTRGLMFAFAASN